jgi:superfamily II DNA or RNA helicase
MRAPSRESRHGSPSDVLPLRSTTDASVEVPAAIGSAGLTSADAPVAASDSSGNSAGRGFYPTLDTLATRHGARRYQREIALETLGHLTASPPSGVGRGDGRRSRSALIQAPTGAGKTFIGLLCASVLALELGLRVGWCAGRRELLRQAESENAKFGFGLDLASISMFDKHPPKVDLLVVDEAHHDGAMSMATLHGCIDPSFVIGLTATPFRRDRVKLCFEKTVKSCSIQMLVDEGYLSAYRHFMVERWVPEELAALYASDRAKWGRSLFFFRTLSESRRCVAALARLGVRAELVTAASDREAQLAAFDAGAVDVLVSMNVLTEGFDCPSLATVFCRPSSRLPTVQMCGRVFRKHASAPFKQVVQSRDTELPFARVVRPAEQYLMTEFGWRSLGATRELDAEIEAMRIRLAQTKTSMPKAILKSQRRSRRGQGRGVRGLGPMPDG